MIRLSRGSFCLLFSVLAVATLLASLQSATPKRSASLASESPRAAAAKLKAMEAFLHSSLPFEANLGQTDPAAKFIARGMRYTVFFTRQGVLLRLADPQVKDRDSVLGMTLVGARDAKIQGLEPLASHSHYFHGKSPKAWQAEVPHYGKVSYTGAYPDTNLVFYGRQGELEYDVVLGPGANPRDVVLQFSGAEHLRVNREGDLVLELRDGREILQRRPKIYQQSGRTKTEVSGGYRILAANRVRFEVGGYDRSKALVIDPVLSYSSYLGGSGNGNDGANAIALDASGNAYIAGYTASVGFPTGVIPPIQASRVGGTDAFIASLSADGSSLRYSTYLGGSSDDYANGIAVDASGNTYVTGYTYSSDFPATPGAYAHAQPYPYNQNVFVAKLGPSGSNLVYATYLGPGTGAGIAADAAGNAYVVGAAYCCSFPTTAGAYQRLASSTDVFITKLNATGSALAWSTLLGGNSSESATAVALDPSLNVYVTGSTNSSNFPVTGGAYRTALAGNGDAFVSKVNSSGSALLYSTFLGGSGDLYGGEQGKGIAVDSLGFAYVAGYTYSTNFPTTPGAYQAAISGYQDAFVAKMNQAGTGLVYSTHLGSNTQANGIAIDSSGNAYISLSVGTIPVTSGAYNGGGCCAGITKLNSSGTALIYSSQFSSASLSGIALDGSGNAYVAGSTSYSGYPTTSEAFQPSLAGSSDAVVTKLNSSGSALVYSTFLGGNGGDQGLGIALDSSGNAYVTGSAGSLDFPITTEAAKSPTGPYTEAFVTKFNAAGTALSYSTFVGGSGNDTGRAIAVDTTGAVYVAGQTNSSDFPVTLGALQTAIGGGYDAFLFKLTPVGRLSYSTFLGGSSTEDGRGVALDSAGNAYVAGNTYSSNFLATSIIGPSSYSPVFITKVNTAGSAFIYSTLVGGSNSQTVSGIAVDSGGSAYITGNTYSSDFPVTNGAYQTVNVGSPSAFVTKLNPAGSTLSYSTYLGGSSSDSANSIAIDTAGNSYVAGFTSSTNFPITNGTTIMEVASSNFYSCCGSGGNAFVASLNPSGSALQYSTYFGGTTINGIASRPGSVSVVGTTSSPNLIGASLGFQKTLASGATNAFIAKISDPPPGCTYNVSPTTFNLAGSGASGTVNITAGAGCPWLAAPDSAGVVQFNPPSGTTGSGTGSVNFTLPYNADTYTSGRVLLFTVAGQLITVVQAGGCAISLQAGGAILGPGAIPSASIGVNGGSCSWNTFTNTPWITIANYGNGGVYGYGSGYSTSGDGSVNYKLLPNLQGGNRTGTIYIGPLAFPVTQLGNGTNLATITSPTGTVLPDSTVTFTWTTIPGASQYTLAAGSGFGLSNYCLITTSNTSATCSNLPTDGSLVYVSLTTSLTIGGGQTPVRYVYTAATASLAQMLNPGPVTPYPGPASTALPGTQTTFNWSRGVGADLYWLDVGTAYQSGNICSGPTTSTVSTCSNIPCNGSTIYAQLWTHDAATGWHTPANNYVYLACTATLATITSPTPATTIAGSSVTFKWTPGTGADNYWLDVGTSVGQGNICGGATPVTQSTCHNIPTTGIPIYVQLYTHANGVWQAANQYTYTSALLTTRAQLTSPLNTLPGPSTTFTWNAIGGADQYWLDVGNTVGQGDICAVSTVGTQLTCNNIPVTYLISTPFGGSQLSTSSTFCWAGRTIYAQLWTHLPGTGWQSPVKYALAAPPADFWLDVGTVVGQGNISAGVVSGTCKTVTIPSILGLVYVQLWTHTPLGTGSWYGPVQYSYQHP